MMRKNWTYVVTKVVLPCPRLAWTLPALAMGLLTAAPNTILVPPARADQEVQVATILKYSDDFKDPKKLENDSDAVTNAKVFPNLGLSSANSNPGYAIWDLDRILPGRVADSQATLVYTGGANGPKELRGVTWATSKDGKEWKSVSVNEFDKPIKVSGQYLRATMIWIQAGGPDYGFLGSFSIKAPAAPKK